MNQQTTPVNGFERRGPLFVPAFDLERDAHAEPAPVSGAAFAAGDTNVSPEPEPIASPKLGEASPAPVDGNTERVQEHKARVAEADRIRALPTERVLARRQALAEAEQLARLDTTDHARRLYVTGERERAEIAAKAATAAARRSLESNVDVRALQLGRRRQRWTAIAWTVLVLAMLFTMTNVQAFAAAGAPAGTPQWWVAWGVDPLLSLLVVGLLLSRGDLVAVGSRGSDRRGEWIVQTVEIGVLLATVAMNVAPEVSPHVTSWALISLHVIVPLAAVAAALVLPIVQEHYATAIVGLYESAGDVYEDAEGVVNRYTHDASLPAFVDGHEIVSGTVPERAPEPAHARPSRTPRRRSRKTRAKRAVRMALADYVDAARGHLTDDTVVTAAWVMETVHCPRSTAYRVVDALQATAPAVSEEVPA